MDMHVAFECKVVLVLPSSRCWEVFKCKLAAGLNESCCEDWGEAQLWWQAFAYLRTYMSRFSHNKMNFTIFAVLGKSKCTQNISVHMFTTGFKVSRGSWCQIIKDGWDILGFLLQWVENTITKLEELLFTKENYFTESLRKIALQTFDFLSATSYT